MKIKKNDNVIILNGKDQGKVGLVTSVMTKRAQVIVKGVNMIKKHQKKSQNNPQSGIIEKFAPLVISRVAIICPSCSRVTRVGYLVKGDNKIRVCRKCQASLDDNVVEKK